MYFLLFRVSHGVNRNTKLLHTAFIASRNAAPKYNVGMLTALTVLDVIEEATKASELTTDKK